MTTRDQARRRPADARLESARSSVTAVPAPTLPERLLAARERKGVDLYRAERDTKIRARYLAALERGDWRELPGAVYTKGFLRNYALYLGLDPDDILVQWRSERGDNPPSEPVIVVPRPIVAPRQGLTFSPGLFVAIIMIIGVAAFAVYLGIQLLRFAKPPTIAVTDPATAVSEVDDSTTTYTLRGTSQSGATISVTTPGRDPSRTTAGPDGTWSIDVDLRRGRNQFDVTATDPDTGKQADQPAHVFITVPFSVVLAPTLTVDQPNDGATFENGAIPVQGTTTNATSVTVTASYLGPTGIVAPAPSSRGGTANAPGASTSSSAPPATPKPPSAPAPQTVPVGDDGSYQAAVELTAGRWAITVTAASTQAKTTTITRNVSVMFKGVNLVVTINGSAAWIKVWVDGQVDPTITQSGKIFNNGKTLTFSGTKSVEVRTGNSGSTYFTLNGTSLGALGKDGNPETWLFAPPDPPVKTQHQ
jgi:cytoskeletal protein RodZ